MHEDEDEQSQDQSDVTESDCISDNLEVLRNLRAQRLAKEVAQQERIKKPKR